MDKPLDVESGTHTSSQTPNYVTFTSNPDSGPRQARGSIQTHIDRAAIPTRLEIVAVGELQGHHLAGRMGGGHGNGRARETAVFHPGPAVRRPIHPVSGHVRGGQGCVADGAGAADLQNDLRLHASRAQSCAEQQGEGNVLVMVSSDWICVFLSHNQLIVE